MDPPGYDDGYDDGAGPPSWPTGDGYVLAVPAPLWGGWRSPHQPWRFRRRRPRLGALAGLARHSTRIGTLRSRRSGAAFPVFAASAGGRRWGLVTRPRRELEAEVHEIVAVRPAEELEFGLRPSPEPIPPLAPPAARPGTTADGWRLRLPHQGVHSILSRLRPDDLAKLAGGTLPADPAPTVVRSVARLAARSRRRGSLRSRRTGQRMELFEAPGYSLLVRPAGEMEGEILAVRPTGAAFEGETGGTKKASTTGGAPIKIKLNWLPPCRFDQKCTAGAGNRVYIVVQGRTPLKVGSTTQDADRRMSDYRGCTNLLSIPPRNMTFYLADVQAPANFDLTKVESLVIRLLNRLPRLGLTNTNLTTPRKVDAGRVEIQHTGAIPPFMRYPFTKRTEATTATHVQQGGGWTTTIEPDAVFETPWG